MGPMAPGDPLKELERRIRSLSEGEGAGAARAQLLEALEEARQSIDGSASRPELERKVANRTRELQRTVDSLQSEVQLRMVTERELREANRALRMLSAVDQALVRSSDERAFLAEICRIAVEVGAYRMAWVGLCDRESHRLVPVACAGVADGFLERAELRCEDEAVVTGPIGRAVETGRPAASQDILTDPAMEGLRDDALAHGYASMLALPLVVEGEVAGVLVVCSDEPGDFVEREVALLDDVGRDMAFGIEAVRGRDDRRRAEAEVREANLLLEQMFSNLHICVAYMAPDFTFRRVNRAYAESGGHAPGWFVGRNHFDVYPHEENQAIFEQVVRTGEPYEAYEKPFTYPDQPDRGETWWDWTLAPVRGPDGEVEGVVLSLLEVTARVVARRRSERERERLFGILDMLPGYVYMHGSDYHVRYANRRFIELFGEPEGRPCYEVVLGRDRPCERCTDRPNSSTEPFEMTAANGREYRVYTYRMKDGEGGGQVLRLGLDVTERKRLEREVAEAAAAEQRRIGHDLHDMLGQNLTGAAFMARVLAQRLRSRKVPEAAGAADVEQLLNRAIAQTRALARGLCPVDLTPEGLMTALKELARGVDSLYDTACRLECDEPVLVPDNTVATQLYYIAQEAVHNAVKHAEAEKIIIRLARAGDLVTLEVQDDGSGFLPDGTHGDGMGLHIMNYRAGIIGGALSIRAEPGRGTTVACTFPVGRAMRGERHHGDQESRADEG